MLWYRSGFPFCPCYRRRVSAQSWRRKPHRDGWPTTVVAKDGRVATSINAGLRPPPPAAYGVDSACHPAADCHQEVDGKVRPVRLQMSCRKISLRQLCADPDRRSQPLIIIALVASPARGAKPLTPESINEAQWSPRENPGRLKPVVLKAQVLLDRAGFSPGVIDAHEGANFEHWQARRAHVAQARRGLPGRSCSQLARWRRCFMRSC